MLDHRKPVRDQALCQKRHIPVEGNIDQVSNPVLENNMAKKKYIFISTYMYFGDHSMMYDVYHIILGFLVPALFS